LVGGALALISHPITLVGDAVAFVSSSGAKIGRASCRERV